MHTDCGFIVKMFPLHKANMSLFQWSTSEPELSLPLPEAQLCKARSGSCVYTPLHHFRVFPVASCGAQFHSVKQLTPTLCLSLWLCKTFISRVFFLFVFLSLKPKKLKTLFIIRTSCLHQLKLLMKTGHHTCVLWYRCYTCGLRLQCELIKDLSRSLQVVVDVQFAALDHL